MTAISYFFACSISRRVATESTSTKSKLTFSCWRSCVARQFPSDSRQAPNQLFPWYALGAQDHQPVSQVGHGHVMCLELKGSSEREERAIRDGCSAAER